MSSKLNNISAIINDNNIKAKKKFGQNFLIDQNILKNIVDVSQIDKNTNVIEIGPGLGSLTGHIASRANHVLCYEIDKDLIPVLKENLDEYDNVDIICADVLDRNVEEDIATYFDDKPVYLISNLPYYITTPIILKLLSETNLIKQYVLMMQKEVAKRICSKPSVKDYNALSIVVQYKTKALYAMDVPRTVFVPQPNVDSAVIKLSLYETLPYKAVHEDYFYKFIRAAFVQRRKTFVNNIATLGFPKSDIAKILEDNNYQVNLRSEQLSLKDFVLLSDIFYSLGENL